MIPRPFLPPVDDDALIRASQAPIVKVAGASLFFAGGGAVCVALQFAIMVVRARPGIYGLHGVLALAGLVSAWAGLRVLGKSLGAARLAVVASAVLVVLGLGWLAVAIVSGLLSPLALLSPLVSGLAFAASMLAVPHLRVLEQAHAELLGES